MADQPIRVLDLRAHRRTWAGRTAWPTRPRSGSTPTSGSDCPGTAPGRRAMSEDEVLALAEACLPAHEAYDPELYAEMVAMADGAGSDARRGGHRRRVHRLHRHGEGRRWQPPAGGQLHRRPRAARRRRRRALVRPDLGHARHGDAVHRHAPHEVTGRPEALVFTTVGCLGQIGMNEHGPVRRHQQPDRRRRPHRRDLALRRAQGAGPDRTSTTPWRASPRPTLAGGHNFFLLDRDGRGYDVEAMPTATHVIELGDEPVVHTNHCLAEVTQAVEGPRAPVRIASTENRYARAVELLGKRPIDERVAHGADPGRGGHLRAARTAVLT